MKTRNARCNCTGRPLCTIAAEVYQLGRDLGQASERNFMERSHLTRRTLMRRMVEGNERYILPGDRLTSPKAAKERNLRGSRMAA